MQYILRRSVSSLASLLLVSGATLFVGEQPAAMIETQAEVEAALPADLPLFASLPTPVGKLASDVAPKLTMFERLGLAAWASEDTLSDHGLVAVLYDAGFRGNALVTMAATCYGESRARVTALGDTAPQYLRDGWVGSYSICQIRAKEALRGTGEPRDPDALAASPQHVAWAAWIISQEGTNFSPWTIYKNGVYRQYLSRMERAARDLSLM